MGFQVLRFFLLLHDWMDHGARVCSCFRTTLSVKRLFQRHVFLKYDVWFKQVTGYKYNFIQTQWFLSNNPCFPPVAMSNLSINSDKANFQTFNDTPDSIDYLVHGLCPLLVWFPWGRPRIPSLNLARVRVEQTLSLNLSSLGYAQAHLSGRAPLLFHCCPRPLRWPICELSLSCWTTVMSGLSLTERLMHCFHWLLSGDGTSIEIWF